jgi:hypothetical protein
MYYMLPNQTLESNSSLMSSSPIQATLLLGISYALVVAIRHFFGRSTLDKVPGPPSTSFFTGMRVQDRNRTVLNVGCRESHSILRPHWVGLPARSRRQLRGRCSPAWAARRRWHSTQNAPCSLTTKSRAPVCSYPILWPCIASSTKIRTFMKNQSWLTGA